MASIDIKVLTDLWLILSILFILAILLQTLFSCKSCCRIFFNF